MPNSLYYTTYNSPVGKLFLVCDEKENLTQIIINGQKSCNDGFKNIAAENDNLKIFDITKKWLDRYFKGEKPDLREIPLNPSGSKFQSDVWQILREIPYGKITTYGEIAKKIAQKYNITKMSAQAVGGALGSNPVPIIIPCHRVIGKNGSLTGYTGGIEIKKKLLEHEKVNVRV